MTPDLSESDRALVRGIVYELDGLDGDEDRLSLVHALLLANDLEPNEDVVYVRGEDGALRLDTLRDDADAEAALQHAREMVAYAGEIQDDELEMALNGSIRRRADLPLSVRLRDRLVGAWDRLTGGLSR
ncbi:hypothetical protein [Halalkalicoccus jeotgali]|uniref:Uncharacterized protein n=1 Tax=Halalkalicoccus jeotgali (strain DSM 18796 / CECT 7217 / JCM 14584 / KCTC 4019 / B3) TaxID=795797 RepID=D8JC53_HALJB|nr:hypothetical protein [Halalkalicoccus jeotgali]ADJ16960.1 hypothetical protein HacjB3_18088 [Halalkalicoccus jeotgali B3]ADJ16991.1 hypothetical protein HacjB3_18243 [Halalkalicoccus jeotgali B3]ELY38604.1 hypothetical protein C497_06679 [Halalkalicoccus jeotgali B3]